MRTQKIEFPGSQGATLAGRLDTPDHPPQAWAIFAHCFTCSKDSKAAAYVSRALDRAGFGVLRFDFTGLGSSDGDFANTHFSSNVDDLIAAADWLRAQHGAPALLIGHSLGACTAMTLRMYARKKKWPMDQVTVDLMHSKIHASDCAECETRDGKVDRIERVITITGALDAEQRQRLMEIADKCPVHRTLHSEVLVVTRAAETDAVP